MALGGTWPEPIPFIHSSFKYFHYFTSILFSIFQSISSLFFYLFHLHKLVFYISFHSFLSHSSTFVCSANFIVHWLHDIAYPVPFFDAFLLNFDFLLFSLICLLHCTFHLFSHITPHILFFHLPLGIYLHFPFSPIFPSHSIFHSTSSSRPYSMPFHSGVHCRQSPYAHFLHLVQIHSQSLLLKAPNTMPGYLALRFTPVAHPAQ